MKILNSLGIKRSEILPHKHANKLSAPRPWRLVGKMRHWAKEIRIFIHSKNCSHGISSFLKWHPIPKPSIHREQPKLPTWWYLHRWSDATGEKLFKWVCWLVVSMGDTFHSKAVHYTLIIEKREKTSVTSAHKLRRAMRTCAELPANNTCVLFSSVLFVLNKEEQQFGF